LALILTGERANTIKGIICFIMTMWFVILSHFSRIQRVRTNSSDLHLAKINFFLLIYKHCYKN
jgi:hypothetical protein